MKKKHVKNLPSSPLSLKKVIITRLTEADMRSIAGGMGPFNIPEYDPPESYGCVPTKTRINIVK